MVSHPRLPVVAGVTRHVVMKCFPDSYLSPMRKYLAFFLTVVSFVCAQDWSLDRPYTLRTLEYLPLLDNLHQQTTGSELSGIFPRRDSLWRTDAPSHGMVRWQGKDAFLLVNMVGGYELRALRSMGDTVNAINGGLRLRGYKDSVEFWLDARIYNESHSVKNVGQQYSWDREFLEVQDSVNGKADYTSYARYRGHLAIHMGWARLDFGRDAVHWGPGYYGNLTFNQQAIPFPQMSLETHIGPLTVKSLYADLNVSEWSMSGANTRGHNLYAHRYEIAPTDRLVLAINEQTMVDSINEPILFVPIIPLFMQKGQMTEDHNNGTISMDACYRKPGLFRVYGEFLLDDMASPVTLIKNNDIESKWAAMGGVHLIHNYGMLETGFLSEIARVEPWVYTHFVPYTAQIAHQGVPLGNPLGPNSLSIDALGYGRWKDQFYGSLRMRWWWKGVDDSTHEGSDIEDATPNQHYKLAKQFLYGAKGKFTLSPSFAYTGKYIGAQLELSLFDNPGAYTALNFQW